MSNQGRFCLGTAQLGTAYGVANTAGYVPADTAAAILRAGEATAVDLLDTAVAYGDAEARLGLLGLEKWNVVTKLPPVPDRCHDVAAWVHRTTEESLERLGISQLYGLLLHRPDDLLRADGNKLLEAMISERRNTTVQRVGISLHGTFNLTDFLPRFELDIVQAPFNLIDQRLLVSGWLDRLAQDGVEVHVRSIFLQGLLLMSDDARPEIFDEWRPIWDRWTRWLDRESISALDACVGFALSQPGISKVVVGVEHPSQLEQIVQVANRLNPTFPKDLMSDDMRLIDPSRW